MLKVGVFGTCRIDNYNFDDFIKKTKNYPYIYTNKKFIINIRPLGYTVSSSEVLQNLMLINNKKYLNISNKFIFNNIFLKHGGRTYIKNINYDYLVIEICSKKKIIHKPTNYIFPYEIEGRHNKSNFHILIEDESETINNIIKIRDLINCKIILLPPIIEIKNFIKGQNTDVIYNKILDNRTNLIKILKKVSVEKNIYFIDWNE